MYFADDQRPLTLTDIARDPRRTRLYHALLAHPGIGLVATRAAGAVHLESRAGRGISAHGHLAVGAGDNPLAVYGTDTLTAAAVEALVQQSNAGDLVLFGAYDGRDIVSFDDQIGAHGSAGGDQLFPFIIAPAALGLRSAALDNARDIYRVVMSRYAVPPEGTDADGGDVGPSAETRDRKSSPVIRSASASPSSAVRR